MATLLAQHLGAPYRSADEMDLKWWHVVLTGIAAGVLCFILLILLFSPGAPIAP